MRPPEVTAPFYPGVSVGDVLDAYFSCSDEERIWVMSAADHYTSIVRQWSPVKSAIASAKFDLQSNPEYWEKFRRTDPSWKPTMTDPPKVQFRAWKKWVSSPPGTDPKTAAREYIKYRDKTKKIETPALHTAAIGSFGIYVTVDEIDCDARTATLDVWMYNAMDKESFGSFGWGWIAGWAGNGWGTGQARQYMWWNWKEKFKW